LHNHKIVVMSDALKRIRQRAKQLQKKKPNAKWTNLIKEASREYRNGSLGAVRSAPVKKVGMFKKKNPYHTDVKNKSEGAGLSISAAKHFIKKELEERLGRFEVRKYKATTKRGKKMWGKEIQLVKSELRKYK